MNADKKVGILLIAYGGARVKLLIKGKGRAGINAVVSAAGENGLRAGLLQKTPEVQRNAQICFCLLQPVWP
jgi:hypothetical protein